MMANSSGDVVAKITSIRPYGTTAGATPDNRAGFQVWDFDATTTEYAYADGRMRGWDGSTSIVLRFGWIASTTAGTGEEVRWEVGFWRLADEGDDVDGGWSGATEQGVSSAAPATCGQIQYAEITFTSAQIDSIANGELFRLRIFRDHDHADDDMAGDAELKADSFELVAA